MNNQLTLRTTVPRQRTNYDYQEILGFRANGENWRTIAAYYGVKHPNAMKWFNLQTEKREAASIASKRKHGRPNKFSNHPRYKQGSLSSTPPTGQGAKTEHGDKFGDNDSRLEYHRNMTQMEIIRTKYGKLEPTHYISPLKDSQWMKHYLGQNRYRWDLEYIDGLHQLLREADRELGLLPRASGKTTIYQGNTSREIIEIRQPHLTICSPKRPKLLFRGVLNRVVKNPNIRRDYGDIIAVENGIVQADRTEKMMFLHEEFPWDHEDALYRVASRETDIIGSRPAHVHFEDPTQQETERGTEKLKDWYLEVVDPMLSIEIGVAARQTGTMTRKGKRDFAAFLFDNGWDAYHLEAITVTEGELPRYDDIVWKQHITRTGEVKRAVDHIKHRGKYKLLNPHWSLDRLLEKCARNYSSFMSQYQNSPLSRSGLYFNRDWWQTCPPFDTRNMQKYLVADTSYGRKTSADYTCVGVWVVHLGKLYLVDLVLRKQLSFDQIVQLIRNTSIKHRCITSWVHASFREVWITQKLSSQIPGLVPVKEQVAKVERINALDTPFRNGEIVMFESIPFLYDAYEQWIGYDQKPSTETKKDDFPDMVATAYDKLRYHLYADTASGIEVLNM